MGWYVCATWKVRSRHLLNELEKACQRESKELTQDGPTVGLCALSYCPLGLGRVS